MWQVAFPEPDVESSIKLEREKIVVDTYGKVMDGDKRYACEHYHPIKAVPTQRTLLNAEKYVIMQLKIFGYNRSSNNHFKVVPNLVFEEEMNHILLGKLHLYGEIYHIGESTGQGHCVCYKR